MKWYSFVLVILFINCIGTARADQGELVTENHDWFIVEVVYDREIYENDSTSVIVTIDTRRISDRMEHTLSAQIHTSKDAPLWLEGKECFETSMEALAYCSGNITLCCLEGLTCFVTSIEWVATSRDIYETQDMQLFFYINVTSSDSQGKIQSWETIGYRGDHIILMRQTPKPESPSFIISQFGHRLTITSPPRTKSRLYTKITVTTVIVGLIMVIVKLVWVKKRKSLK